MAFGTQRGGKRGRAGRSQRGCHQTPTGFILGITSFPPEARQYTWPHLLSVSCVFPLKLNQSVVWGWLVNIWGSQEHRLLARSLSIGFNILIRFILQPFLGILPLEWGPPRDWVADLPFTMNNEHKILETHQHPAPLAICPPPISHTILSISFQFISFPPTLQMPKANASLGPGAERVG